MSIMDSRLFRRACRMAAGAALLLPTCAWTATQWVDFAVRGDTAYFLFQSPQHIARFDMGLKQHRQPLSLPRIASELHVDRQGIYYGAANQVFRLDGSNSEHLANTDGDVLDIVSGGGHLFVADDHRVLTLDPATGQRRAVYEGFYRIDGYSSNPHANQLFGRSLGVSPSDIHVQTYDSAGQIISDQDSPYHGDYSDADRTWVDPEGQWVIDDSGIVYRTTDLKYEGSLGGRFDAIAFSEDAIFVARDRTVLRYSRRLVETGRVTTRQDVKALATYGRRVYAFMEGESGQPAVRAFNNGDFGVQGPGPAVDPNGLAYLIDDAFMGKDGNVYILSAEHRSIFIWSVAERAYRTSIPLVGRPLYFAYDTTDHEIFVAYEGGLITSILLEGVPVERPFVNSPQTPCGLATAGVNLFVCDPSGAWESHFTYSADGELIDQREWNYFSLEYIWSPRRQRMYFLRDDTSPNDLHFEQILPDGHFGEEGETPDHSSAGIEHPVRVSGDGQLVLLGSGRIYDAVGLTHIDNLGGVDSIDDATWRRRELFTIRAVDGGTQLDRWTSTYTSAAQFRYRGSPLRVFAVPSSTLLLVITEIDGVPRFFRSRQR